MKYHIWSGNFRMTLDDENEDTKDVCVSLEDGVVLDNQDELDNERLDVEAMDAAMAALLAKHDLNDPEQRAHLVRTLVPTREHAIEKITYHEEQREDHQAVLDLSEKYLGIIAAHDKKRKLRSLR